MVWLGKRILLYILKIYRKYISPLKRRSSCVFVPCCSLYAVQSIEKYGAVKGTYLSFRRIIGCHPYSKGGYDPVP